MTNFIIAALGALLASNQPVALSNLVHSETGIAIKVTAPNDPVEKEFKTLMEEDDAAQAEVDQWIRDNAELAAKGGGIPNPELNQKIRERFAPVRKGYEKFIDQHTNHVGALVAYASFLHDLGEEEGERKYLERALEIDKTDPAIWNNLANYHGHRGPVKKAFSYYEKAIELDPNEPVYYHNFGTTVFLFRKDVKEYYDIDEQQVFDKALGLYSNAMRLAPRDFPLASDVAQTYYGIKPPRTEDALRAWTNAFNIANDAIEREGVHTHFARIKLNAGRFEEARAHLDAVTNAMYADLKNRLERNLREKSSGTNTPPAANATESSSSPNPTNSSPSPLPAGGERAGV
ncbi:MAG TPA: tetratricopeptide repeat protein, partial [Verrucomicrobiae bacterium]|nr:tetratricopeptide repeat protein [Verrucomicrobiae bacterium]